MEPDPLPVMRTGRRFDGRDEAAEHVVNGRIRPSIFTEKRRMDSATGEILKSEAGGKIADLVHKLAGPAFEEFGIMFGNQVRAWRLQNAINVLKKTQRKLRDAGLPANAIPPRLFLPLVEACSVEDNESLQDMWAGLLATASQQTDAVPPSFIETLKQLTPDEAKYIDKLYWSRRDAPQSHIWRTFAIDPFYLTSRAGMPAGVSSDTYERLGLIRREFNVKLLTSRLRDARTIEDALDAIEHIEPQFGYRFVFTEYGVGFLGACRGPRYETQADGSQS